MTLLASLFNMGGPDLIIILSVALFVFLVVTGGAVWTIVLFYRLLKGQQQKKPYSQSPDEDEP